MKIKEVSTRAFYEKKLKYYELSANDMGDFGESREALEKRETILRKQLVQTQVKLFLVSLIFVDCSHKIGASTCRNQERTGTGACESYGTHGLQVKQAQDDE